MCIIRASQSMEYMEVAKQTSYVDDTQRLPRNVRLAHATSWLAPDAISKRNGHSS